MENRQSRSVRAFKRALGYLEAAPITPPPPLLVRMVKSLEVSVRKIDELAVAQIGARHTISGRIAMRVAKLRREKMLPLARMTRPLLAFAPDAERALAVPHAHADSSTVAAAALRMANFLSAHAKLLVSAGASKTLLVEFKEEARELSLATKNARAARQQLSKITRDIAEECRKAMKALDVIDGIMMLHFAAKPHILLHWKRQRRIGPRLGRPTKRSKLSPTVSS